MNDQGQESNRRILIIDDNRAIHDDFRKILSPDDAESSAALDVSEAKLFGEPEPQVRKVSFQLDSAYQGQEGVAMVEKALAQGRPYSMAFVDVRMPPGWDGVETTSRMLKIDPRIQIVICTAYADYSWDDMFARIGDRDGLVILKKPFDTVEALQLAFAFTEKWRLHCEAQARMQDLEARVDERTREIRRANLALRESEERFSRAFEYAAAGMALVSPEGSWIKVNRALCDLFGYSAEDFDQELWETIMDPTCRDNDLDHRRKLLAGEVPVYHVQKRCIDRHGRTVWVILSVSLVWEENKPRYFIWQLQDITKRKRAEQQLSLEYAISRILAESVGENRVGPKLLEVLCLEFEWDAGVLWRVTQRSDALRRAAVWPEGLGGKALEAKEFELIAAGSEGIPGRVWASVEPTWVPDLSAAGEAKDLVAAHQAGYNAAFAFPILIESRVAGVVALYGRKARELDEDLKRILVVLGGQLGQFFQRIALEDKLFQAEKLKTVGKLAGGVAHEFNSILTAIIGRSEMMLAEVPEGSRAHVQGIEIRKAAERAAVLTRQLLAYGRKQFLRVERLDMNQVILGMEGMLGHLLGAQIDIRLRPGDNLAKVEADAGQIEEVIVNLALNSADAMPNGGKLTLQTSNENIEEDAIGRDEDLKAGAYVMLAISDTGIGMTPKVRERAFEPFFTTKEVGKGSGLGLATCYGIVKQSGGHITIYSEPDRGTTVKIYLPRAPDSLRAETKRKTDGEDPMVELPRGTETILLVEDDRGLREMAEALLRRLGYTVVSASNGAKALALANTGGEEGIDLLFTDIVMPEIDGLKLAEGLRSVSPSIRVLFASAYTGQAIDHQGLVEAGADLLEKPFTPSALARKVRQVLDRPSSAFGRCTG